MNALERIWYDDAPSSRVARALLTPFEFGFRGVMEIRNRLYDERWLPIHEPPIPAISVGNLTVGGTGKTPIAAYFVARLVARGAKPAIVLRGYGEDETRVHSQLNPGVELIADPDRVRGGMKAASLGCQVIVMDDAFQHRRAGRTIDTVLVSAERYAEHPRFLPAGPWREGLESLRRASLVLVTRKSATSDRAQALAERIVSLVGVPVGIVSLEVDRLIGASGESVALEALAGKRVLAVAGIGNPGAFAEQLRAAGLRVELRAYGDHHAYSAEDAGQIVDAGSSFDAVVCTLKDAVKLTPLWPRSGTPMLYVSQRVVLELGAEYVDAAIERVLAVRP